MDTQTLGQKTVKAIKWSMITQIVAKLISPVTTIILTHILAPEAFGVVATVTMVTSFAEMFADAGFQKYLIQHEYEADDEFNLCANVAFWTNLVIALFLWLVISLFRDPLAAWVGNPGLGHVLIVACASLPLITLSSVQIAIYQRAFDFKTLFGTRVGSSIIMLVVTVPLALTGLDFWALIIGAILKDLFLAVVLTIKSSWKPSFMYSFSMLKEMFSFSMWMLLDSFAVWLTSWAGTFVLGSLMNQYYLGLYKTSVSIQAGITGIVTTAVCPIIFSSLSRIQSDDAKFKSVYLTMQKTLAFAVVPLAVALFVFRHFVVGVMLGEKWLETTLFFGLYSASAGLAVVFGYVSAEGYRALGLPRIALFSQLLYFFITLPAFYFGGIAGYATFSWLVPLVRAIGSPLIDLIFCWPFLRIKPQEILWNQRWIYLVSGVVGAFFMFLIGFTTTYFQQFILGLISVVIYYGCVIVVPDLRQTYIMLLEKFNLDRFIPRLIPKRFL